MKNLDLHEEFLNTLYDKIPKKNIVNRVSEILKIEKDAAYRRLNRKVNFSIHEMGIISETLNISLDRLMQKNNEFIWLPFKLERPLRARSLDEVFDVIDYNFELLSRINPQTGERGSLCNNLPLECYLYSPVLTKFMFFKWGHYFMGTKEFDNYSDWKLPLRANNMLERLNAVYNFNKAYYIMDDSFILSLAKEIRYFHKIHVITTEEKEEIKMELKDMLNRIEQCLNGTYIPTIKKLQEVTIFVCPANVGFTCNYFMCENIYSIAFNTNFSFCMVDNDKDAFYKLKNWVDSFRNISTLLSQSGRIERRIFFEEQHKVVDYILN